MRLFDTEPRKPAKGNSQAEGRGLDSHPPIQLTY